jgi:hypothetical protein
VWVVLHRVAHDVGHFVETAVVEGFHRVEYAPLHGFETILDVGDGALEYHVGRVVEKPAAVHAAQLMLDDIGCCFLVGFL